MSFAVKYDSNRFIPGSAMAEKLYYSIYPFSSTIVSHPGDHYLFLKHVMTEIFMLVALCAGLAPQVYE